MRMAESEVILLLLSSSSTALADVKRHSPLHRERRRRQKGILTRYGDVEFEPHEVQEHAKFQQIVEISSPRRRHLLPFAESPDARDGDAGA